MTEQSLREQGADSQDSTSPKAGGNQVDTLDAESDMPYLTSWCGGDAGNLACNYNCKLCLIIKGKAELIGINGSKFTYRIKEQ